MADPATGSPSRPPQPVPGEMPACDVVMKGGITSGVVYPKAVARIAHSYRIDSVGGTSVGAIAAAVTAAAEYWRQSQARAGDPDGALARQQAWFGRRFAGGDTEEAPPGADAQQGYAALWTIPEEIGGSLLAKFQPAFSTRGLFHYLVALLDTPSAAGKVLAAVWRQFYISRVIGAFVIAMLVLALERDPEQAWWLMLPVVVLVLLLIAWAALGSWIFPARAKEAATRPGRGVPKAYAFLAGALAIAAWIGIIIWRAFDPEPSGVDAGSWFEDFAWLGDWRTYVAVALLLLFVGPPVKAWLVRQFTAGMDPERRKEVVRTADRVFVALGLLIFLWLVIRHWDWISDHRADIGIAGTGALIGWVLGGMLALAYYLGWAVPRNRHGICTGLGDRESLTNWLSRTIDRVAGVERPLTFGDLRQGPPGGDPATTPAWKPISLEMIASDLTRGVPLDLPRALRRYGFNVGEFRDYFPPDVMETLLAGRTAADNDVLTFPDLDHFPVVVAARMSLSFPVLFSAVPVMYRLTGEDQHCWLSDGGIVSNFPVHKFDAALPGHPTFAIDLISRNEPRPTDGDLDQQVRITPIGWITGSSARSSAIASVPANTLPALFARILDTARGWIDNSQKTLPGYAERIVGIYLYQGEGGLNLNMDAGTIRILADRGLHAVDRLVQEWDPARGPDSQWFQHRWLRYRIIMRALEELGYEFDRQYGTTPQGMPSIRTLVEGTAADPPHDTGPDNLVYEWEDGTDRTAALLMTKEFAEFADLARASRRNDERDGLFDQPVAPSVEPEHLMVPPFE